MSEPRFPPDSTECEVKDQEEDVSPSQKTKCSGECLLEGGEMRWVMVVMVKGRWCWCCDGLRSDTGTPQSTPSPFLAGAIELRVVVRLWEWLLLTNHVAGKFWLIRRASLSSRQSSISLREICWFSVDTGECRESEVAEDPKTVSTQRGTFDWSPIAHCLTLAAFSVRRESNY